jgi:cellulose biosynthesis protein BcsQ
MTVVAVVALKGGTGKSSVSVLIVGEALARDTWSSVILVDRDPRRTSSTWLGEPVALAMPDASAEEIRALDRPGVLVVVDLPGEAAGSAPGMAAAHRTIAVTGPTWPDMRVMPDLERMVEVDAVVVNRVDVRRRLHKEAVERLSGRYGDRLIAAVPFRAEMEAAAAEGRPVMRSSDVGGAGALIVDRIEKWSRDV